MDITSPVGRYVVTPPSVLGARRFRILVFAKVPRTSTSWLPRRDPYELKSDSATPWPTRYRPAGESFLMLPAGEMWSVVTLSPRTAITLAPRISGTRLGLSRGIPSKYGGRRTYVELAAHSNRSPPGTSSDVHRSSPSYTAP